MKARYRYRLYPTEAQQTKLAKTFGCARVVFNDGLRLRQQAYADGKPYIKDTDLQKLVITQAKQDPEREWLGEVASVALVQSLQDLHQAFRNFFSSATGKRKGQRVGMPRFKSRRDKQAIRLTRNGFKLHSSSVFLTKIGHVRIEWSRPLPAEPSSVSIIRDRAGRYFASFVCDISTEPLPWTKQAVGIDVGLATFATFSTGEKVENPRWLRKAERRLRMAQKSLSRKQKGSQNRVKARLRVAKLHARVADARQDFLHKLSTRLIRENQTIAVEDLCIKGLARTRLAKSIYDAGLGSFLEMLRAKAIRYGRELIQVGRCFPSSQVCSACGIQDGPKPLNVRQWICHACRAKHDRDINAAKNILAAGLAESLNTCGDGVSPGLAQAIVCEAGTYQTPVQLELCFG